ncbi:MAG: hypothetical protein HXY24_16230 [Rubrivivax sp.]|nr:hypothetical protein [Rubrivivax sp.]
MSGHIKALVQLVEGTDANYFANSTERSYPTIIQVGEESFSSQVQVEDAIRIKSNAMLEVVFRFLVPEEAIKRLKVGSEFSIWEQKLVGKGRVTEVFDE